MLGGHVTKGWSITQSVIALSAGEAEHYGIVDGSACGIMTQSLMAEIGKETLGLFFEIV